MSSQPEDLAEILAAIARQEADEKLARELAAQFAQEASLAPKPPVQSKNPEEDTKTLSDEQFARELVQREKDEQTAQLERDTKFAEELAASEKAASLASKSLPEKSEKDTKTKSDEQTALELQQHFNDELVGNTTDGDLALALSLSPPALLPQFQLEKDRKQDSDTALAAALQSMEDEGAAGLSEEMLAIYKQVPIRWAGKTPEERKKITEDLQGILASAAVAGEKGTTGLTDAHKFTSTLIRAGIPVLTNIDGQFNLSSIDLPPDQVQKEVLEFLEKLKKEGMDSRISIENIQKTFGHVRSNPAVEASETQANAHHLLSRTWTLAKTMGRDGMTAVATLLSDNIGDGGSCIPGLIARLYPPYAKMLAVHLGVEVSAPRSTDKATVKVK